MDKKSEEAGPEESAGGKIDVRGQEGRRKISSSWFLDAEAPSGTFSTETPPSEGGETRGGDGRRGCRLREEEEEEEDETLPPAGNTESLHLASL